MMSLPNNTCDPCWSSRVTSDDTLAFAEISESTCAGPVVDWPRWVS